MGSIYDIYGDNADINFIKSKTEKISAAYRKAFGKECEGIYSSPGRAEILGNHTDHNKGLVLVGAINQDILAACGTREDGRVVIISEGFEDIVTDANDTAKRQCEEGKSVSLVRGIIKGFGDCGYAVGGFSAVMESSIFKGAGVSSSAAYEVLICKILSDLYCGGGLQPVQLARISQYAESEYFGKPCGLLDQSGIAFGGVNHIDFADTVNPVIKGIDFNLKGFGIVITNCGGDHTELTAQYAAVKDDMRAVSGYFGKEYLREVNPDDFYDNIAAMNAGGISGRALLRAVHYFEENKRVDKAEKALKSGNTQAFLDCVNESGDSSYRLLQNCYAEGDPSQGIPLAIELTKRYLKGRGAVRVHGGGFAGTVLAFVPDEILKGYAEYMKGIFGEKSVFLANIRKAGTEKIVL